ncbi:MAG: alpha/beta hydrolase [Pirellulales bacterium]|nr:alpha/beta hydrolase [Pirellulales bacterium]
MRLLVRSVDVRAVVAALLLFVGQVASVGQGASAAEFAIDYQTDIEFGTGGSEKLLLDLAKPKDAAGPRPGMILIHGGGWAQGGRNDFADIAKECAAAGYVAATIEYRLAPEHKWPAQIEDCKCAVRWMRAHAQELGVDPDRIGCLGGSAGGHLALLLGTMGSEDGLEGAGGWSDQSSRVQAVVDFFGPAEMVAEFEHQRRGAGLAALVNRKVRILEDFLGGTPDEVPELYKQASPVRYVTRDDAPTLILQGTHDILVPYDQSIKMSAALAKKGVPGRMELVFGAGHGWQGDELDHSKRVVFEFLEEHLTDDTASGK